jgi:peptidoglycan/LPS O-acetylase OafA/YrhL
VTATNTDHVAAATLPASGPATTSGRAVSLHGRGPSPEAVPPNGSVRSGEDEPRPSYGLDGGGPKARLDHVDAMRPVKQAGVVSTHTLLFFAPAASLAVGGALMLLHVTREAFLFISACMLTYSYYALRRGGYGRFYRRRVTAVLIPYLCWTLIYFFVTLPQGSYTPWTGFAHFWYLAASGYYQLYYLLVIMEFYVVFPLLLLLVRRTTGHHVALLVASLCLQVLITSLMHWQVLPPSMTGFWATRDILSYQFYLLSGMVVALHLDEIHAWVCRHVTGMLIATVAAAAVAEVWFVLAARHIVPWLGSATDPLQPIVIPFNIGAIVCIYILGVFLVDRRRSTTVRAMVRSGSDDSYGIYLAQMVFVLALASIGWRHLDGVLPWPVVCVLTLALVFGACILLTSVLARTPLAVPLTGRRRQAWHTWLPERWRRAPATPEELAAEVAVYSPIDPEPANP